MGNYLSWLRDPESNPYIQGTDRNFKLETLVDYIKNKNASENCVLWGIYTQLESIHIGNIKFEPIIPDVGSAWVGILIGEIEFRGIGLGSEALSSAISYFSEISGIRNFHLGVDPENETAVRTYKNQGFTFDVKKSYQHGKTIMSKIQRS